MANIVSLNSNYTTESEQIINLWLQLKEMLAVYETTNIETANHCENIFATHLCFHPLPQYKRDADDVVNRISSTFRRNQRECLIILFLYLELLY